jgi:hypothetical protein
VGGRYAESRRRPNGELIGPNHNPYIYGDEGDQGLVSISDNSFWHARLRPNVFVRDSRTGSTHRDETYYIRKVGLSDEGRIVCQTGSTSGSSCGRITDLDRTLHKGGTIFHIGSDRVQHLGEMENCRTAEGDSGGPVYRDHVAYGLLVGTGEGCATFYQGIVGAQNNLNVNVITRK